MEKKILLAVDGSVNAMGAIHYATQMVVDISELRFDLMYVQPALSQYLTDEARTKQKARKALEKAMQQNKVKADEVLARAAKRMMQKGVEDSHIERLSLPRDAGVAKDLLVAGEAKSYDAILVGRRGASYVREWVMGSVTANLVEHSKLTPVWVVDGEVDFSNVLLAADGSPASLRALDHMAFILSGDKDRKLRVLHVRPRFKDYCEIDIEEKEASSAHAVLLDSDRQCMDDFYAQALAVLQKYSINKDRLEVDNLDGRMSISRSVVQYSNDNRIETLVLGRRGRSGNPFTGSVSRSILNKATDMALWVVP